MAKFNAEESAQRAVAWLRERENDPKFREQYMDKWIAISGAEEEVKVVASADTSGDLLEQIRLLGLENVPGHITRFRSRPRIAL